MEQVNLFWDNQMKVGMKSLEPARGVPQQGKDIWAYIPCGQGNHWSL